jgi:hypothetical protein
MAPSIASSVSWSMRARSSAWCSASLRPRFWLSVFDQPLTPFRQAASGSRADFHASNSASYARFRTASSGCECRLINAGMGSLSVIPSSSKSTVSCEVTVPCNFDQAFVPLKPSSAARLSSACGIRYFAWSAVSRRKKACAAAMVFRAMTCSSTGAILPTHAWNWFPSICTLTLVIWNSDIFFIARVLCESVDTNELR